MEALRKRLEGKKLLVLGGAYQHCKLVEAAHDLGVYVIVDDYLPPEKAPAKAIADKYYMHNVTDIEEISEICRKEKVDGVISTSLDACQVPYQKLCEGLGLPCFGTAEQFQILTDKTVFKQKCREFGLDIIPEYYESDFADEATCSSRVQFPVFIKPCDSRGSRGQSICYNYEEARRGIAFALENSTSGKMVIEKYIENCDDFSMTLIVINGEPYVFRTLDRFLGKKEDGLDKLCICAPVPSIHTKLYLDNVHRKVGDFIKGIGLVNAPIFMQGFVDNGTIRFYDPGLRLPGGEYERMFKAATGKNILYPLVEFALTGAVSQDTIDLSLNDVWINGRCATNLYVTVRPGEIADIKGVEEIKNHPKVVSMFTKFSVGDRVEETHDVNQRYSEINLVCDNTAQLQETIKWVFETLSVTDTEGNEMLHDMMDLSLLDNRKDILE